MKVLEADCSARMQGWLKARKSIDVKYHINRTRNMTHIIISIGIENMLDKNPTSFQDNIQQLEIEETVLTQASQLLVGS